MGIRRRCLVLLLLFLPTAFAWEWSDLYLVPGRTGNNALSFQEVAELRVREIKRRLALNHGYLAEELAKMIHKQELIRALAFEEEKLRLANEDKAKQSLIRQGILAAIVTILITIFWPLIQRAWDVAYVNFVVYTDRKRHEATRCWELQSYTAMVGVVFMGILDVLQVWLTASVLLSWVMPRSKYFFPVPNLPVRPAQLLGSNGSSSSGSGFGINVGSMVVTWAMRFCYGKIELWTGQALKAAHLRQREQVKRARREGRERRTEQQPPSQLPTDWMEPTTTTTPTHQQEFLEHVDHSPSRLDELD